MVELPPGIPLTLQVTAALDVLLTVAVNPWGSPSKTDTEGGATLTVMPEGGGCDGPDPATPPQPRKNATRINVGRHGADVRGRLGRPRSFLMCSIEGGIARSVPERCTGEAAPDAVLAS